MTFKNSEVRSCREYGLNGPGRPVCLGLILPVLVLDSPPLSPRPDVSRPHVGSPGGSERLTRYPALLRIRPAQSPSPLPVLGERGRGEGTDCL